MSTTPPEHPPANEAAVCRVCRSEGSAEQPLFQPCLCSGSIKHVHQACLQTWLQHSGKRHCELCKHPFHFSPVFASQMPASLPLPVVIVRGSMLLLRSVMDWLWYLVVIASWLFLLPVGTAFVWKLFFGQRRFRPLDPTATTTPVVTAAHATTQLSLLLYDIWDGCIIVLVIFFSFIAAWMLRDFLIQQFAAIDHPLPQQQQQQQLQQQRPMPPVQRQRLAAAMAQEQNERPLMQPPPLRPYQRQRLAAAMTQDQAERQLMQPPPLQQPPAFDVQVSSNNMMNTDSNMHEDILRHQEAAPLNETESQRQSTGELEPLLRVESATSASGNSNTNAIDTNMPPFTQQSWDRHVISTQSNTTDRQPLQPTVHNRQGIEVGNAAANDNDDEAPVDRNALLPAAPPESDTEDEQDADEDDFDEDDGNLWEMFAFNAPAIELVQNIGFVLVFISCSLGLLLWFPAVFAHICLHFPHIFLTTLSLTLSIAKSLVSLSWWTNIIFLVRHVNHLMTLLWSSSSVYDAMQQFLPDDQPAYTTSIEHNSTVYRTEGNITTNNSSLSHSNMANTSLSYWLIPPDEVGEMRPLSILSSSNLELQHVIIGYGFLFALFTSAILMLDSVLIRFLPPRYAVAVYGIRRQWNRALNFFFMGLKVVVMCALELLVFPVACGVLLDICTFPLFFGVGRFPNDQQLNSTISSFSNNLTSPLNFNGTLNETSTADDASFIGTMSWSMVEYFMGPVLNASPVATENPTVFLLAPILHPMIKGVFSRILFHEYAPATSLFLHWLFGTLYMYYFSSFVAMCRSFFRKGLLWFIRDPQDDNFNPIKEMVEQVFAVQVEKISVSALVYFSLISATFGVVTYGLTALHFFARSIIQLFYGIRPTLHSVLSRPLFLPLNYSFIHTFSDSSLDLLFIHFIVPLFVRFLRPVRLYRRMWRWWFAWCSRLLSLSSFVYGNRWPSEEHPPLSDPKGKSKQQTGFQNRPGPYGEGLVRVLATDKVSDDVDIRETLGIRLFETRGAPAAHVGNSPISLIVGNRYSTYFANETTFPLLAIKKHWYFGHWRDPIMVYESDKECVRERSTSSMDYPKTATYVMSLQKDVPDIKISLWDKLTSNVYMRPSGPKATMATIGWIPALSESEVEESGEADVRVRNATIDTTVVYRPPHLRRRIYGLLAMTWLFSILSHATFIFVPILTGRWVLDCFRGRHIGLFHVDIVPAKFIHGAVHDSLAFVLGFTVFFLLYYILVLPTSKLYTYVQKERENRRLVKLLVEKEFQRIATLLNGPERARFRINPDGSSSSSIIEFFPDTYRVTRELTGKLPFLCDPAVHSFQFHYGQLESALTCLKEKVRHFHDSDGVFDEAVLDDVWREFKINTESLVPLYDFEFSFKWISGCLEKCVDQLDSARFRRIRSTLQTTVETVWKALKVVYISVWVFILLPFAVGTTFDVTVLNAAKLVNPVYLAFSEPPDSSDSTEQYFPSKYEGLGTMGSGVEGTMIVFSLQNWVFWLIQLKLFFRMFGVLNILVPGLNARVPVNGAQNPRNPGNNRGREDVAPVEVPDHVPLWKTVFTWPLRKLSRYLVHVGAVCRQLSEWNNIGALSLADFHFATVPILFGMIAIIWLPYALAPYTMAFLARFSKFRPFMDQDHLRPLLFTLSVTYFYPVLFVLLVTIGLIVMMIVVSKSMLEKIREEEYLVGRILHNVDESERERLRNRPNSGPTGENVPQNNQVPVVNVEAIVNDAGGVDEENNGEEADDENEAGQDESAGELGDDDNSSLQNESQSSGLNDGDEVEAVETTQ